MLKPIQIQADRIDREGLVPPANDLAARIVFRLMHGFYGNPFISKYATGMLVKSEEGQTNPDEGKDKGILSARKVWAESLQRFDEVVIVAAIEDCKKLHPKFPPSLPEFLVLCHANKPAQVYKPEVPAIGMSQELRSQYARKARGVNEKHAQKAMDARTGYVPVEPGLRGLFQCIANAVATAGGDEVAELLRLDRMYPQGATA